MIRDRLINGDKVFVVDLGFSDTSEAVLPTSSIQQAEIDSLSEILPIEMLQPFYRQTSSGSLVTAHGFRESVCDLLLRSWQSSFPEQLFILAGSIEVVQGQFVVTAPNNDASYTIVGTNPNILINDDFLDQAASGNGGFGLTDNEYRYYIVGMAKVEVGAPQVPNSVTVSTEDVKKFTKNMGEAFGIKKSDDSYFAKFINPNKAKKLQPPSIEISTYRVEDFTGDKVFFIAQVPKELAINLEAEAGVNEHLIAEQLVALHPSAKDLTIKTSPKFETNEMQNEMLKSRESTQKDLENTGFILGSARKNTKLLQAIRTDISKFNDSDKKTEALGYLSQLDALDILKNKEEGLELQDKLKTLARELAKEAAAIAPAKEAVVSEPAKVLKAPRKSSIFDIFSRRDPLPRKGSKTADSASASVEKPAAKRGSYVQKIIAKFSPKEATPKASKAESNTQIAVSSGKRLSTILEESGYNKVGAGASTVGKATGRNSIAGKKAAGLIQNSMSDLIAQSNHLFGVAKTYQQCLRDSLYGDLVPLLSSTLCDCKPLAAIDPSACQAD